MAGSQFLWDRNDLPVALMLEVQVDNIPISGIIPTVEIYKYPSHLYADFNANIFVASGGNKFGNMSGVPSNLGLYHRSFNPQDFAQSGNQIYYMRYQATVPSGVAGLIADTTMIGTEIHYFTDVQEDTGLTPSFIE